MTTDTDDDPDPEPARNEDEHSRFALVEHGEYRGVPYIVVERWFEFPHDVVRELEHLRNLCGYQPFHDGYYCGYAKATATINSPSMANVETAGSMEVTYGPDSSWWVGFDTAHAWSTTRTDADAIKEMKQFITDLIPLREP